MIDLEAGNSVTRQKISAEAAIMNPNSKIIALKGKFIFFILIALYLFDYYLLIYYS